MSTCPNKAAKALLCRMANFFTKHPEKWTHGAWARNHKGKGVDECSRSAVKWCALGYLNKHTRNGDGSTCRNAVDLLSREFTMGIALTNDGPKGRTKIIAAARRAGGCKK